MRLMRNSRGFTLIEILVTLGIVSVVMMAVYSVHIANTRAINQETERVEMQQSQRISIDFMARELRMAGYDKREANLPAIVDARSNFVYIVSDRNEDGAVNDAGEHSAFCIYDSPTEGLALGFTSGDTSAVGNVGNAPGSAALANSHTHASNPSHSVFTPIEEIEFLYTVADVALPTVSPTALQISDGDIRSVVITMLARADANDPTFNNTETYPRPSGLADWGPYNDGIRRRLVSATVRFRNLGLGDDI